MRIIYTACVQCTFTAYIFWMAEQFLKIPSLSYFWAFYLDSHASGNFRYFSVFLGISDTWASVRVVQVLVHVSRQCIIT